jgi:ribosomal protein L32
MQASTLANQLEVQLTCHTWHRPHTPNLHHPKVSQPTGEQRRILTHLHHAWPHAVACARCHGATRAHAHGAARHAAPAATPAPSTWGPWPVVVLLVVIKVLLVSLKHIVTPCLQ